MAEETENVRDRISVSIVGGIADVRLTRPDKMNALDPEMFRALVETADHLAKETSVRAVVLSGEGRSFCAGLDFASFTGMADSPENSGATLTELSPSGMTHHAQQAVYGWTELPMPVIAAVHGHALGGGIQLALGADIRIVHPEAKMSVLEIRWGLIPDMTGTQQLVDLVGPDVAKELTFTGRMISGTECKELGLATRLSLTPLEDSLVLARDIAQKSPHAIRATKRLMSNAARLDRATAFAREREEIGRLIGSPNQAEAIVSYFENRPAVFTDPGINE